MNIGNRRWKWGVGLAWAALAVAVVAAPARRKVIIDQDAFGPGGPNLQPILLVLQSPDVEVLGITVESGDGWLLENVAHTLRMLEIVGRTDIPVVAGSTYPLVNSAEATKRWEARYGKLFYKGAWTEEWSKEVQVRRPLPHGPEIVPLSPAGAPTTKAAAETAANFLVSKVREFPGEVTILAMGPMTNLALAVRLDDTFAAQAKELVFMGGSFSPHPANNAFALEYMFTPRLEFNFRWDPEAAKAVLHARWLEGWRKNYANTRTQQAAWWNLAHAVLTGDADPVDLARAVRWLRLAPVDMIRWNVWGLHRADLAPPPLFYEQTGHIRSDGRILPYDERPCDRWNTDQFKLDRGANGWTEMDGADVLEPYWMARFHGFIVPAAGL